MTIEEIIKQYRIPVKILKEYENWNLRGKAKNEYDDSDIEHLSTIMTLYDIGFTAKETEQYMKLLLAGKSTHRERMNMLNKKRMITLDEIHFKEKQLDRLDYLRYEMQKS